MEHDLFDIENIESNNNENIENTENDAVQKAIEALEAAAFPERFEPEAGAEEAPEPEAEPEMEAEPEEQQEPEEAPEPVEPEPEEVLETEMPEAPEPDPEMEPQPEPKDEPVKTSVFDRIKRHGWFAVTVGVAAVVVVLLVMIALLLPGKQDDDTVSEAGIQPVQMELPEPEPSQTLYISRVENPEAPEKEYLPKESSQVVEKTPIYWGVDVSEHQQEIDWQAVADSGVDFAMIRAGYRGYTEGQVYADEYFDKNISGALSAGLDVGIYFFSQAVTVEEAVEEAKLVIELAEGYDITYPVVYDWEFIESSSARTYRMSAQEVTDCALAFCEAVADAGYTPMLYFGQNASMSHFELDRLMVFDFWLADYSTIPVFMYDFQMWQYTSSGTVGGIDGAVDLNYCFTDYRFEEASQ